MEEKCSRKQHEILNAVIEALEEMEYTKLTIEDIAVRAGVGKSTIYRWWKHKSDVVFSAFAYKTESVFDLDFDQSLKFNLQQQLLKLSHALSQGVGRALLVVMAEHRESAGKFFQQYLLPRRELVKKLIQNSIERKEIIADYPFDIMLDSLYAPLHYQIIFFNKIPDEAYISKLVDFVLNPILIKEAAE